MEALASIFDLLLVLVVICYIIFWDLPNLLNNSGISRENILEIILGDLSLAKLSLGELCGSTLGKLSWRKTKGAQRTLSIRNDMMDMVRTQAQTKRNDFPVKEGAGSHSLPSCCDSHCTSVCKEM